MFKKEKFTEVQAWIWLIEKVSYAEHQKNHLHEPITLKRGQIITSNRYLSGCWGWGEKKVRGFLQRLEKATMIATAKDSRGTLITLCNYSKYQDNASPLDSPKDSVEDLSSPHHGLTEDSNNNKGNKNKQKENADDARADLVKLYGQLQEIINSPVPLSMALVEGWISDGADPVKDIIPAVEHGMRRLKNVPPSTLKYFAPIVAEFKRQRSEGLPKTSGSGWTKYPSTREIAEQWAEEDAEACVH